MASSSNRSQFDSVCTLWFTGLPCSGKSTLAIGVGHYLKQQGHATEVLDGDVLRASLCKGLGFSKADRDENVARIGWVCNALNTHGVIAIAAAVSPYREARQKLRLSLPSFIEIYVKASLTTCVQRDIKGMYAKALKGELHHFTGIDAPYEEPSDPEVVVETDKATVSECVDSILQWLGEFRLPLHTRRPLRLATFAGRKVRR